ncbi:DUF6297 family protein [Nonomuraea sp. NPDC001636]|uniref:DUF6297 family protein n=1 Tax=Nonomuraea sp. NPDC001636 TaxID=3154391 RepID=UPI0033301A57
MSAGEVSAGEVSVRSVRAFVRARGRAPAGLVDRYVSLFGLCMLLAVVGQPLSSVVSGLGGTVEPGRTGAGVALVLLGLAGCLALARAAGPVMVPAAEASWLLTSPLDRRRLLGRSGRVLMVVALVAGLLLGLGLLAALGAPGALVWRLLAALAVATAASVAGMALAMLAQSSPTWNLWLTGVLLTLLVLAVVAVSGQARTALAAAANAPLPALAATASAMAALAAVLARRAWGSLAAIPTRLLLTASTRAGHVTSAAVTLDPGALSWIAEDNHWRARKLASRPWPGLPAPLALAWQDWVRLGRRPWRLAATAASAALPAVFAQAGAAPAALGLVVLGGALAVAASGTSGARRDADNPALARLTGVGRRPALAARALLPGLLGGVWAALALAGVVAVGGLPSGAWLFGLLSAPALAAGALRMARRGPVDHSMPVIDTPGGAVPTGPVLWAATGADLALLGCLPAVVALATGPAAPGGFLAAQAVAGLVALAGVLVRPRPARRSRP